MPLYEYQCEKCGRFELIRKFSDDPLAACPTCGSSVEKLLSAPAIQFKGTGWYITDYARKGGDKSGGDGDSKDSKGSKDPKDSKDSRSSDSKSSAEASTSTSSSSASTPSTSTTTSTPSTAT